jgi:hypothetical protein
MNLRQKNPYTLFLSTAEKSYPEAKVCSLDSDIKTNPGSINKSKTAFLSTTFMAFYKMVINTWLTLRKPSGSTCCFNGFTKLIFAGWFNSKNYLKAVPQY